MERIVANLNKTSNQFLKCPTQTPQKKERVRTIKEPKEDIKSTKLVAHNAQQKSS